MSASESRRRAKATLVGQRLGRYRIEESVGRGGMAEVYRAHDDQLAREVAVKVILSELVAADEVLARETLDRFLSEARLVASLEHPHILPIYDVGEHDGLPFLVMPWIPGGTLARHLAAARAVGQTVPPGQAAEWIGQLAAALDAAHAAGVLHRDVKPANVLLGQGERAFLADFGIARLHGAAGSRAAAGNLVGTPLYMPPEVVAGEPAQPASDLYSLAVMAYELLAGEPPFTGENLLSILHQHATRPAPPLTRRAEHLPERIEPVLTHALAKDPGERPRSCGAFAAALAAVTGGWSAGNGRGTPAPEAPTLALPVQLSPSAHPPAAAAELEQLLARHPDDSHLRFARVLVHHLEREPAEVVATGTPLYDTAADTLSPAARAYLARLIADAHRTLDAPAEARRWEERAGVVSTGE